DVSGREYIDYLMGSGPLILGHAHPAVVAAVREALEHGTTYFLVNEPIVKLADELCRAVRCAEQVRFTSTGTEATFFALRVARAYRKRDKIMKFEGGYHGGHDYALMSAAPRSPKAFPAATPDSAGIPHVLEGEVLIAPYNDLATVEALLAVYADELAAVIVEPFQRLIPPQRGFLEGLRTLTRRHGIPLIFDEVVTGFRFAYGGAQEYYGVVPDLAAYGKIIGGGFPLAAVCGRRRSPQGLQRGGPATGSREGRVEDLRHARPWRRRRGPDAHGVRGGRRRGVPLRAGRPRLTREPDPMGELTTIAASLGARLRERKETIAVAESSAGGLISAALLAVPGASAYFLGGAVIYTQAA